MIGVPYVSASFAGMREIANGIKATAAAARTLQMWREACDASTGRGNRWREAHGRKLVEYCYTIPAECPDGAIKGGIFKGKHLIDTFAINADGTIAQAPAFLTAAARPALTHAACSKP